MFLQKRYGVLPIQIIKAHQELWNLEGFVTEKLKTQNFNKITPFNEDQLQCASYDLLLAGSTLKVSRTLSGGFFEGRKFGKTELEKYIVDPYDKEVNQKLFDPGRDWTSDLPSTREENIYFLIWPGDFVLASTKERVYVSHNHVARVEGKSSLARLGLTIHSTAGFIDPGFDGQITLELSNLGPLPIKLRPNMRIAQICFMTLTETCDKPYGSEELNNKYQNQEGATESKYHLNKHNNT